MQKHICHICTTFNSRSGSARRTKKIIKACLKNGYKVSLIIGDGNDFNIESIKDVQVFIIQSLIKPISLKKDILSYLEIKNILSTIKPDLVHTHLAKAGILGRLAAYNMIKSHVPIIVHTIHGPTFPETLTRSKQYTYKAIERWIGKKTDYFIFVGKEIKQSYIDAKVCNKNNSQVIRTAKTDSQINYLPLSIPERNILRKELCENTTPKYIITYIARVVPSKQHHHAIEMVDQLRKQGLDVCIVIVGKALLKNERNYEAYLKKISKSYGIFQHVHFCGFREDIMDIINASDAVVLTSKYEGLPNIVIESILAYTPIVTYKVSGVSELLSETMGSNIVAQGDINQLIKTMKKILLSKDINMKKIINTRASISRFFTNDAMINAKLSFYQKII